ncbi:MAG: EsaB/YukD family protein, partial [Streptomycetales bacterium]
MTRPTARPTRPPTAAATASAKGPARGSTCRVTVIGPERRVDLAVPAATAVAEALPEFVRLCGVPDGAGDVRRWSLGRLSGEELPGTGSLGDCGVLDGEVLVLRHPDQAPARLVGVEVLDTVTETADAAPGRWTHDTRRVLRLVAATVPLVALPAVLYAVRDQPGVTAAASALAVALSALAVA